MLNKENIEIIYPGIMVFRNGVVNPEKIIEEIANNSNWDKWYDIGEQILFNPQFYHMFDHFPNNEEWNKSQEEQQDRMLPVELFDLSKLLELYFFQATQYYQEYYGFTLPNWMHGGSNLLRYEGRDAKVDEQTEEQSLQNIVKDKYDTTIGGAGGTKEMTLPFHTDFYQGDEFEPGLKAEYTVTMYLNADYEGGEIDFRIFNDRDDQMRLTGGELVPLDANYGEIPAIMYKPQAGDLIIFPSRVPYYHGVRRVSSGTKYFVRMFWMSVLGEEV